MRFKRRLRWGHFLLTLLLLTIILSPFLGLQAGAQAEPETLILGFYGSPDSTAAKGMGLALDQMTAEGGFDGADGGTYRLEALISTDPAALQEAVAVLALPPQDPVAGNAVVVSWSMPVLMLDSDAPLALPGVQATVFRGMTPRNILDETLLDFLTVQSGVQRILLIGELEQVAARLVTRPHLEIQQQPSTLLTSEEFRALLDANPQAIFFNGDAVSGLTLAEALSGNGWSGYFIPADLRSLIQLENFDPPPGIRIIGVLPWTSLLQDDLSRAFSESFRLSYEQSPDAAAVAAYDLTWAVRLLIGRIGADPLGLVSGLPITEVIRTTQGSLNPAAYGGFELYRNAIVFTQISATEREILARYDNRLLLDANAAVVALPTATLIPSPTPNQIIMTVTNETLRVRQGPGDGYQDMGELTRDQQVVVLGELRGGGWYLIQSPWGPGWVRAGFGEFFNPGLSLPEIDPPAEPTATFQPTPIIATVTPSAGIGEVQIVQVPGGGDFSFALGGQVASVSDIGLMKASGMTWVKEQVRWERGENAAKAAAGAIQAARANGMRILIGSVGWNYEMGHFDTYLDEFTAYLAEVASLGPDAIEIWNEPNLDREWVGGRIDGATYTRLLQKAYTAIKAANPNVLVISGAPSPTGFFQGCTPQGCDDDLFLHQMAEAGAANYLDCVGMHFNEGIISPDQTSGDPRGSHHSYYLLTMLDLYSTMLGGKPICITELGYLSGEDFGGVPPGFEWASGTSIQEHADWLGQAVALARRSGRVKLVVIWNVNFKTYTNEPRAGYAIIRADGSCPACLTLGAAMN